MINAQVRQQDKFPACNQKRKAFCMKQKQLQQKASNLNRRAILKNGSSPKSAKEQSHRSMAMSQPQPSSVPNGLAQDHLAIQELKSDMKKHRNKTLLEDNLAEERIIKRLRKQMNMNKSDRAGIPQDFVLDGLDYLLETCDLPDTKQFEDYSAIRIDVDRTEPFIKLRKKDLATSNKNKNWHIEAKSKKGKKEQEEVEEEVDAHEKTEVGDEEGSEHQSDEIVDGAEKEKVGEGEKEGFEAVDVGESSSKRMRLIAKEDIYGRPLDKNGAVITEKEVCERYVPPSARIDDNSEMMRLKRQLKGLINRLAESNLHHICTQIEALYMRNSRNDINETLVALLFDALITNIPISERLLLEIGALTAILHANVGCEVGAHFMQQTAMKFAAVFATASSSFNEDKTLDNIINVISQLYNFQICNSQLIFDILDKLSERFDEKCIECILNILRSVGLSLRKDDLAQLQNLLVNLQQKASVNPEAEDNPRVKFMLDILLAIKNNNFNRTLNYDPLLSEHLKKIAKQIIRKGNYVTQLNIGLQDLLQAETNGKWWVVGSAWSGLHRNSQPICSPNAKPNSPSKFSMDIGHIAKKQRMNTLTRRNIFSIILSSQDYLEAFEKLLHLSLRNDEEREIINVLLHCCVSEKDYNDYYAILVQKFCEFDRKYQTIIKCAVWDKFNALKDCSAMQISNLAKFLSFLLLENALPITMLKVVEFGALTDATTSLVVHIFIEILLTPNEDVCLAIFKNMATSNELKVFKESIRLFLHHFLLRHVQHHSIKIKNQELLLARISLVDKLLIKDTLGKQLY